MMPFAIQNERDILASATAFSDASVQKAAQDMLRKGILDAYECARRLKSRWNELVPIARLPPELLSMIFSFYVHTSPDLEFKALLPIPCIVFLPWIAITHVCRHFRSVALANPSLWNRVVISRSPWTEVMLKRSKSVPLIIDLDENGRYASESIEFRNIQLALTHIGRTRVLHLCADSEQLELLLLEGLCHPALLLESLSLSNMRHWLEPWEPATFRLPQSLFNGETPRLRHLQLRNCEFSWDTPLLSHLTHFEIHDHVVVPSIGQILNTLERMPLLQNLTFEGASLPGSDDLRHIVNLSHLSTLNITGSTLTCAGILGHLLYPADATLMVRCWPDLHNPLLLSSFSTIYPAAGVASARGGNSTRVLLIEAASGCSVRWSSWNRNLSVFARSPTSTPQLMLDFINVLLNDQDIEGTTISVCQSLKLSDLESVWVKSYFDNFHPKARFWVDCFLGLKKLHTIGIRGTFAFTGFVDALWPSRDGEEMEAKEHESNVHLPQLGLLWLEGMSFNRDSLMRLRDWLRWQNNRTPHLEEVHIVRCKHISKGYIMLLHITGVKVVWDGVEDFSTEDDSTEDDGAGDDNSQSDYDDSDGSDE